MPDLDTTRREWLAKSREMGRERVGCQVEYIKTLTDAQLAKLCEEFLPSSEKDKKPHRRITGREYPETLDLAPRNALIVLRWRIWVAAKCPLRSDEFLFPMEPDFAGLNLSTFDVQWRRVSVVRRCEMGEIASFISYHYLHTRPAVVMLSLVMLVRHQPVGMAMFAAAPQQTTIRYGGETWELARLFILDAVPRNAATWLIGRAVRFIKRNYPEVLNLVSYADPAVGHKGTIYRAANWRFDGMTDEARSTPRADYVSTATGQRYRRRGHVKDIESVQRVPRISKYRYVLNLGNHARVGLLS